MRLIKHFAAALAALAVLPLAAQIPAAAPPPVDLTREASAPDARSGPRQVPMAADDLEAWLDGYMPYALERGQIAGAVVVVVRGEETLLQKGYGFADLAKRARVDPERTLFRPGSVSKLITWTAVMQQVEAGKIDLDKDINTYLDFKIPAFDGKPITMRHIMTHTAGFEESIRHLISDDPSAVMTLGEYSKKALPARVFAPGTTPAYSNYATALAGYVVERVSGMNFDDYVEAEIFSPLGMVRSSFRQPLPSALAPLMSAGYPKVGAKAKPFEIVIPAPAGSMSASGADMAAFMKAHLAGGGAILGEQTARMMHNTRAPGVGPLNTMALGFYEQYFNGRRAIGHGGDTGLFHTYLMLLPAEDIGIYISMNSSGAEGASQAVRSALMQKFADRYFPETRNFAPIDAKTARAHADMMVGHYVMSRGSFTNFMGMTQLLSPMTVSLTEDGKIAFPALDGLSAGARDWVEVEPFVWRDTNTGERLAAEVKDGKVVRFSIDTLSPFTVFEPAPAGANLGWLLPAMLGAFAMVVIAAIGWPVRALVRRRFKAQTPYVGDTLRSYRLSRVLAWLVIAAVAGWTALISAFASDIGSLGTGAWDWLILTLGVLTPLATLGLLGAAGWLLVSALRARSGWWTACGALLLALSAAVLAWVTVQFNLYGFSLVF